MHDSHLDDWHVIAHPVLEDFVVIDSEGPLLRLHLDVLNLLCCRFLSGVDLARLLQTCSSLRVKLIERRNIWSHFLKRDFPFLSASDRSIRTRFPGMTEFVKRESMSVFSSVHLYGVAHVYCRRNASKFKLGIPCVAFVMDLEEKTVIWYDAYDLMTLEEPLTIKLVANHKSCILVGCDLIDSHVLHYCSVRFEPWFFPPDIVRKIGYGKEGKSMGPQTGVVGALNCKGMTMSMVYQGHGELCQIDTCSNTTRYSFELMFFNPCPDPTLRMFGKMSYFVAKENFEGEFVNPVFELFVDVDPKRKPCDFPKREKC